MIGAGVPIRFITYSPHCQVSMCNIASSPAYDTSLLFIHPFYHCYYFHQEIRVLKNKNKKEGENPLHIVLKKFRTVDIYIYIFVLECGNLAAPFNGSTYLYDIKIVACTCASLAPMKP